MKKNLGSVLALYPTPTVVVGAMVDGSPNWVLVGHIGIIGHDRVMVSLAKPHYTNKGIKATKALTINVVDESMLAKADYSGSTSGAKTDKSALFEYTQGETGAPIINECKLVMECEVDDIYETDTFESFICKINSTHADEKIVNTDGKIDYNTFKPVLFEMPTYEYLRTGDVIGKCLSFGKELKEEHK